MEGRNIESLSTKARTGSDSPTWIGVSVGDAIYSGASMIDRDAAPAETVTLLTETPANDPVALHLSGNWKEFNESEAGYLAIARWNRPLKLLEWSRLDRQAQRAVLDALRHRPVICFDGMAVLECFLDAGLPAREKLVCLKTMATLVENQAYPDHKKQPRLGYGAVEMLNRFCPRNDGGYTNPVTEIWSLYAKMTGEIIRADLSRTSSLEHKLIPVTLQMQRAGLGIDREGMATVLRAATDSAANAAEEVKRLLGRPQLNLNAHSDLLDALRAAGIEVDSTQGDELRLIDHPAAEALVRYKDSSVVQNDAAKCLDAAGQDGRIHPEWNALGAGTGRMSCSNPNLTSLKGDADFRRCFIPASGYVYARCDYAQADLRVIAFLAKDPDLIEALAPERDFHTTTAAKLLSKSLEQVTQVERELSKTLIYGISYVMSAESLAKMARLKLGLNWTPDNAEYFIDSLFKTYPRLRDFYDDLRGQATTATEARTVLYRRRRLLPRGPD